MKVVCVVTPQRLPAARVLAHSLAEYRPDWSIEAALVGDERLCRDGEPLAVTSLHGELGVALDRLPLHLAEDDLVALLAAHLLLARIRRDPGPTLHLPPSIWVQGSLEPLETALQRRSVLLVPRLLEDLPEDALAPTAPQLEQCGRVMPTIIGVDGTQSSESFLVWWCEHLDSALGSPGGAPPRLRPEDRSWTPRYLELAPARFSAATPTDDGWAVSQWNLHARGLDRAPDGALTTTAGSPVRFMDLAGFDPLKPFRLSPFASRVRASRIPPLGPLCHEYAQALLGQGWADDASGPPIGDRLANGMVIDEALRRLYRHAALLGEDLGDVRSETGTRRFMAWLSGPAPVGAERGLNRYVYFRVASERPDVMRAYPDLADGDADGFVAWCWAFGPSELGIPEVLLPPRAPSDAPAAPDRPSADPAAARVGVPAGEALSVRVSGYLGHLLGLGAAGRGYTEALQAAGLPLSTLTVPLDHLPLPLKLGRDYGRHRFDDVALDAAAPTFELMCVNADELPRFLRQIGPDAMPGWRIGVWGWETDAIPERWAAAFDLVNEIWVYSRFVQANLARVAPVPVTCLPPPVAAPEQPAPPLRLGVPDGFLFLFVFDYLSTIQRKNPVGLIEAFKQAFSVDEGPQLLIKTINAPLRPLAEEEVLWACDGRPDIHVIDCSLPVAERDGLIAACDCYVSLHRSEGFGLTLAEAMAIGKPVIATGYSGNLDFMTAENSYLVDHT